MSGRLEKPLGVPGPQAGDKKPYRRIGAIVALALFAGALGFAGSRFIELDAPDQRGTEIAEKSQNSNESENPAEDAAAKTDKPATRPDLPIDENAPGLQEITGSGEPGLQVIVPRKRPSNPVKKQVLAYLPDPELFETSSAGKLPVKSPDGLRPLDLYSRKPDTEGNFGVARIVIIVGGLGISQTSTEQAIRLLPSGVTLAFAPYGNSLSRWMQQARKGGHELLMQIPMEPFGYPQSNAGKRSLLSSVEDSKNTANLRWSLGRITNYVGVMNFLGGKMLTSSEKLAPIFDELAERGLMFVDDGSVRNSLAKKLSDTSSLPFSRADMRIDNLRTRAAIAAKLKELETRAKRTGLAIGVATAFPDTITQIAKFLKDAKGRGLELTPVSATASQPKG